VPTGPQFPVPTGGTQFPTTPAAPTVDQTPPPPPSTEDAPAPATVTDTAPPQVSTDPSPPPPQQQTTAGFTDEPTGFLVTNPPFDSNSEKLQSDLDGASHPPHIHDMNVQCSKDMMTIDVEFNKPYDGVIYSKVPSCPRAQYPSIWAARAHHPYSLVRPQNKHYRRIRLRSKRSFIELCPQNVTPNSFA